MRNNCFHTTVIHIEDNIDFTALSNNINSFHIDLIERKLRNSDFDIDEKIAIIDNIYKQLKSRESDKIIP